MTEWVLAGCTKTKWDGIYPAKDLYKSPLFKKRRKVAERRGDGWGILSAKYGFVEPELAIESYDVHISERDSDLWSASVLSDLLPILWDNDVDSVAFFAGSAYVDPLAPELRDRGFEVTDVNRGLRPGERMSALNDMMNHTLGETA